jgi:transcriptional regulator with XRE-family HTH domain
MPDQAASLQRQFGAAVRAARSARGVTQRELAGRAKLSENYVGEIERGHRMVTLITIVRLAAALETKPVDLFGEAGI